MRREKRAMSRLLKLLWWLLAVSVAILFGLRAATALAQNDGCRLTIRITNAVDEAIMDYDRVAVPEAPAEGGEYSVPVICYCGRAIVLGVEDCGTNSLLVESSMDLTNWAPFPQPGFQLTLGTNSAALIPVTSTHRFFRGVLE